MIYGVFKFIKINALAWILTLLLAVQACYAEYIGGGSGYGLYRLNYLPDTGEQNSLLIIAESDLTSWRRKGTGPVSRGPALTYLQGSGISHYNLSLPLYHWHIHHGIWYGREYRKTENLTALSTGQVYLGDTGSPVDLAAGSEITSIWEMTRNKLYWQSDVTRRGVANRAGIYWQTQTSPVEAEFEGITPEIFNGESQGYGLYLGKHQDNKGLNFQWSLHFGQHVATFSDRNTNSNGISESERRQIQFEGLAAWHYRYYLTPYWYLIPQLSWQTQLRLPSKSNSDNIKQKALIYTHFETGVTLRRYF